jgi:hypothetical protein
MSLLDYNLHRIKTPFMKPIILCCPPVIPPLHGLNPRTIMGKEWWDIQRRKVYEANMYHCWACAKGNTRLEAHEVYKYTFKKFEARMVMITALCWECHNFIHRGRLTSLVMEGKVPVEDLTRVENHGETLLINHELEDKYKEMVDIYDSKMDYIIRNWSRWHLLIGNKKFYSKFKTVDEWERHRWD